MHMNLTTLNQGTSHSRCLKTFTLLFKHLRDLCASKCITLEVLSLCCFAKPMCFLLRNVIPPILPNIPTVSRPCLVQWRAFPASHSVPPAVRFSATQERTLANNKQASA